MQMHLVLDDDNGPDDAYKAVSMIAYFVGPEAFGSIVNRFKGSASQVAAPNPVPDTPDPSTIFGGAGSHVVTPAQTLGEAMTAAERDSAGIPWDERVHSSSKAKVADGTWRYKKGLDDATKMAVMTELRAAHGKPATVADPMALPDALKRTPAAPPPPATGAAPPPPASDATPGAVTFIDLMKKITSGIHAGKLTQANIAKACEVAGLQNAAMLSQPANAVHIPTVNAYIDALLMS